MDIDRGGIKDNWKRETNRHRRRQRTREKTVINKEIGNGKEK